MIARIEPLLNPGLWRTIPWEEDQEVSPGWNGLKNPWKSEVRPPDPLS